MTDVYAEITNSIIAGLKTTNGDFKLPWHKPGLSLPENATTKRPYHGINVLALWIAASTKGYETNKWASYKQWQTIGGHVRTGERGCKIIFYKQYTIGDEDTGYDIEGQDDEDDCKDNRNKTRFFIRASTVFNKCQVEGLKDEETQSSDRLEPLIIPEIKAEKFITNSGAKIELTGSRAFYSPDKDAITMPEPRRFNGTETLTATEGWYATILHELVHWTGHKSRLDREGIGEKRADKKIYAFEELIAEIGSSFLCAQLGLTPSLRQDHVEYIAGWLKALESDKKAIFRAAASAEKAAKYLLELNETKEQKAA